jgi:hypothetical protein
MKINLENIQGIFHFGLKILCDGHVTVQGMLNNNRLKMRLFLCDAYVTEQKIKISSSINLLFGFITSCTTKMVINNSFSMGCLFDGYLTESVSYAHLAQLACLTGSNLRQSQSSLNDLFSSISLFNNNWNEVPFNSNGNLGIAHKLFGYKTEEIINELNEALAA